MDLIRLALDRPTAVIAAVIMVVTFGIVALETIPIQMTPDVRRPVIVITTSWPGAAPAEVEREITNRIEEELSGVSGLREMLGLSQLGRSRLILEFGVDQDMREAFLLVSNRLNAISNLPVEADEPSMRTSSSEDRPIARFAIRRLPGNQQDIETYGDFILDVVVDRLERGVGGVPGGRVGRQRARAQDHHRSGEAGPGRSHRARGGRGPAWCQRDHHGRLGGGGQAALRGAHRG
jgi:HAE1 family hydrophobic/amphiphilic exporter-1